MSRLLQSKTQWFTIILFLMLILMSLNPAHATDASIWTDKADYSPGDTVTIHGSGFNGGAPVTITVVRPDGSVNAPPGYVTADDNGGFTTTCQLDGITGTYTVTATDGTNTATTTFTDTVLGSVSLSPTSGSGGSGTELTSTVTVTLRAARDDVLLSTSGVPTGVTVTFDTNPITTSGTGTDKTGSTTMRINIGSTATPSTYTITVSGSCSGCGITSATYSLEVTAAYSVTFQQIGIPSDVTWGVTVSGTDHTGTGPSIIVSGLSGTVDYSYDSPVSGTTGTQYVCSNGRSGSVSGATIVSAAYGTQYYLTLSSAYDEPTGEGWYDDGTSANFAMTDTTVAGTAGTQYVMTGWSSSDSGGYTGSSSSSSVTMDNPITETAGWKTQYYLTLETNPAGLDSPTGESWYDSGTDASISTAQYVDIDPGSSRYRFDVWTTTGDISEIDDPSATSTTVTMDDAKTVTANYVTQYKVTFAQTGLDSNATGTVVTFDSTTKEFGDLPFYDWFDVDTSITYSYSNPVPSSDVNKQFWLSSVTGPASPITVTSAVTVTGNYLPLPLSRVTSSALCYFDVDGGTTGQQFRLIFTQDPTNPNTYKLTASNPGQFYYNIFIVGSSGTQVNVNIQIPYPFITQGAVPIQVFSSVSTTSGCFVPTGQIGAQSGFPLNAYTTPSLPNPGSTSFYSATVTGTIPSSGLFYITMHLDYGLKPMASAYYGGYSASTSCPGCNAISSTPLAWPIVWLGQYQFSVSDAVTNTLIGTQTIGNENSFKKDPGIAGLVLDSSGTPISSATVKITSSTGQVVYSGTTDQDGFYSYSFKYTGKATTFTIQVSYNGKTASQTVTMKSNGFVWASFTLQ